jgi:hypothetical protein
VNVCTEPHVVGEIPTHVVGIFIDHNLIAVPQPIADVAHVDRGHAEIESAEPETAGAASGKPPDVMGPKASAEVAVLPRVIEMQFGPRFLVSDPRAVVMDVRSVGMTLSIAKVLMIVVGRRAVTGCWAVFWDKSTTHCVTSSTMLGKRRESK